MPPPHSGAQPWNELIDESMGLDIWSVGFGGTGGGATRVDG